MAITVTTTNSRALTFVALDDLTKNALIHWENVKHIHADGREAAEIINIFRRIYGEHAKPAISLPSEIRYAGDIAKNIILNITG